MKALGDNLRFLRALLARPKFIGAIAPSGPQLARAMAAQIVLDGPVLELGPGTGAITAAILARVTPERLTAIEYDAGFAATLKTRYPRISVIQGDAFDLAGTLGPREAFAAILSGLPLLNFPLPDRRRLVEGALARLAPGAPFVQFSYARHCPVAPPPGHSVAEAAFAWANLPPARVWVYRRL